jgi:hypothetical protein
MSLRSNLPGTHVTLPAEPDLSDQEWDSVTDGVDIWRPLPSLEGKGTPAVTARYFQDARQTAMLSP